jgi:hypothetical protein
VAGSTCKIRDFIPYWFIDDLVGDIEKMVQSETGGSTRRKWRILDGDGGEVC